MFPSTVPPPQGPTWIEAQHVQEVEPYQRTKCGPQSYHSYILDTHPTEGHQCRSDCWLSSEPEHMGCAPETQSGISKTEYTIRLCATPASCTPNWIVFSKYPSVSLSRWSRTINFVLAYHPDDWVSSGESYITSWHLLLKKATQFYGMMLLLEETASTIHF